MKTEHENPYRLSLGRPSLTPEEVFFVTAKTRGVERLAPVEVQMIPDLDPPAIQASVFIVWSTPLRPYPVRFDFTALGETVDEAIDYLAMAVDDWRVMKTIDLPRLYRDGPQFFMTGPEPDPAPPATSKQGGSNE